MSRYRKIDPRIWNDAKFRELSDNGKLVFFLLLTHPSMTALGAMRATLPGLAAELEWKEKAFRDAFAEVSRLGMAAHDERACLIVLPNFLRYNHPEAPNVVRAWGKAADLLPECSLKASIIVAAATIIEGMGEGFKKAFAEAFPEGIPKAFPEAFRMGMPIQEQEQEQEQEIPPKPPGGGWGDCPDGVCPEAWASWAGYKRGKPARGTITEMANLLRGYPAETQRAMVAESIRNGWRGCFPPKSPPTTLRKPSAREELDAEILRRNEQMARAGGLIS